MERLLTPEEVAKKLVVSPKTVRDWLREGRLRGVKTGKLWRVREDDLRIFITAGTGREYGSASSDTSLLPGIATMNETAWRDYRPMTGHSEPPGGVKPGVPISWEDRRWLEGDSDESLPPFDWGLGGPPRGKSVRYIPGKGLVIEEEDQHGK